MDEPVVHAFGSMFFMAGDSATVNISSNVAKAFYCLDYSIRRCGLLLIA